MGERPESKLKHTVINASGLYWDRVEISTFGSTLGMPDTLVHFEGRLIPVEFKIGAVSVDGLIKTTVRPTQRLWFLEATKQGTPSAVIVGNHKLPSFWLVKHYQVQRLYYGNLNVEEVLTIMLEREAIIEALREVLYGENEQP